jgi:hypothetical protein
MSIDKIKYFGISLKRAMWISVAVEDSAGCGTAYGGDAEPTW